MAAGVRVLMDCLECDKLLEAYTCKTREYLNLMLLRSAAYREQRQSALMEIDSRLQAEREHRAFAKRNLLLHDRAHRAWARPR
jgi:hypothetical protein